MPRPLLWPVCGNGGLCVKYLHIRECGGGSRGGEAFGARRLNIRRDAAAVPLRGVRRLLLKIGISRYENHIGK